MGYFIREGNESDIPALVKMENLCFPDPWSKDLFEAEFSNPLVRYFVAEADDGNAESCDGIIAQIGFLCVADECQINNVAVHPTYRKTGVGSELLELILDTTEEEGVEFWTLEVRVGNDPAIKLYKKFGFDVVGERPNYYENGEAAILMTREMTDSTQNDYEENDFERL